MRYLFVILTVFVCYGSVCGVETLSFAVECHPLRGSAVAGSGSQPSASSALVGATMVMSDAGGIGNHEHRSGADCCQDYLLSTPQKPLFPATYLFYVASPVVLPGVSFPRAEVQPPIAPSAPPPLGELFLSYSVFLL